MANYAKRKALDAGGSVVQDSPSPYVAIKTDFSENNAVSSLITLNDNCTIIEVTTGGIAGLGNAAIRWIPAANTNPSVISTAGTANFDHAIGAGMTRRFVVPEETIGSASIVGANKQNGLYNRVAIKNFGVGSVMTTQY